MRIIFKHKPKPNEKFFSDITMEFDLELYNIRDLLNKFKVFLRALTFTAATVDKIIYKGDDNDDSAK